MAYNPSNTRPSLQMPSKKEVKRRHAVAELARTRFVLLPQPGTDNPSRVMEEPADRSAEVLEGVVRIAVNEMFARYPEAKTSTTLPATTSAVNVSRNSLRSIGLNVNTEGAEPGSQGAAFGLAMVFFNKSIEWAEEQLAQ